MKKIKALIFDLDGTLADTVPALRMAVNATMDDYGFARHTDDEVRSFIGNGARMLMKRSLPADRQNDEKLIDEAYEKYQNHYRQCVLETKTAYEGLPEVIEKMRKRYGVSVAVLTNKENELAKKLVAQILPKGLYDAVQGIFPGSGVKPSAALTNRLLERLRLSPEECLMIGDSEVDFVTAKTVGMRHLGVSWGSRTEETLRKNGVTDLVATRKELEDVLTSLLA